MLIKELSEPLLGHNLYRREIWIVFLVSGDLHIRLIWIFFCLKLIFKCASLEIGFALISDYRNIFIEDMLILIFACLIRRSRTCCTQSLSRVQATHLRRSPPRIVTGPVAHFSLC